MEVVLRKRFVDQDLITRNFEVQIIISLQFFMEKLAELKLKLAALNILKTDFFLFFLKYQ